MFTKIILIVLDSVGIGELPDAHLYGDEGANTLVNIARRQRGLFLPNMEKLGLGCIAEIPGIACSNKPIGCYGKMAEISKGKDTTSGHWEIAGCPLFESFPIYPEGFPKYLIDRFIQATNRQVLGNKVASGTEIIAELGEEHMKTGWPIIYTSADSVFQIAAHEKVIPLDELYELCKIARQKVLVGKHAVGRVIARPFIGEKGQFVRTPNRHDYSLEPPDKTMLDLVKEQGMNVTGIGKIGDIFAYRGVTNSISIMSNRHGIEVLTDLLKEDKTQGLIMVNLVEFDSSYGHRNDIIGYKRALEEFDAQLGSVLDLIKEEDLLIITADHGCDPTMPGTDHTREYVPLLVYHPHSSGQTLGVRATFADISATVIENFNLPKLKYGKSFLHEI